MRFPGAFEKRGAEAPRTAQTLGTKEMGAGIAASPHCAERRICRCSIYLGSRPGKPVSDPASRSWLTSSGVAFHRTAPSFEEPDRSTRLRRPKVRWSFDLSGPASGTEVPRSQNRPVFCGPSWVDHSRVPLRSPTIRRPPGAASRLRKIDSSGASSRLAPLPLPKELWHCLPAEIGPLVTCRSLLALASLPRRPGPPSRSPSHHAHVFRVAKAKNAAVGLWITGISVTTIGTFPDSPLGGPIRSAGPSLSGCRFVPLRLPRAGA